LFKDNVVRFNASKLNEKLVESDENKYFLSSMMIMVQTSSIFVWDSKSIGDKKLIYKI